MIDEVTRDMLADDAANILQACKVPQGSDFHTLRTEQVESLRYYAMLRKYRQPKNANGSRARYFHAMLERRLRAQKKREA